MESLADFANGGWNAVAIPEAAHEVEHLTLPRRQLSHPRAPPSHRLAQTARSSRMQAPASTDDSQHPLSYTREKRGPTQPAPRARRMDMGRSLPPEPPPSA